MRPVLRFIYLSKSRLTICGNNICHSRASGNPYFSAEFSFPQQKLTMHTRFQKALQVKNLKKFHFLGKVWRFCASCKANTPLNKRFLHQKSEKSVKLSVFLAIKWAYFGRTFRLIFGTVRYSILVGCAD